MVGAGLVRTGDSKPHDLSPNGFSYHFGFRRHRQVFVVWAIPYRRLQLAHENRGWIVLYFDYRLVCLTVLYRRQFFALAEDKACIARNDHRDVQRDAKPLAVAMRPCRADSGPDTALLVIDVAVLIDNVVKIVCRFVGHIFCYLRLI